MENQNIETVEAVEVPQELSVILKDSGLELSESETIKQSYLPYFAQMAEIKEQAKKINFENPTELDEKIARELRLKTAKIRTGSEAIKKERKRIHLLKGDVEQQTWNLIKASCLLEEEHFEQIEKRREIAEKTRKEALKAERLAILSPLCENAEMYPLGEMTEESFKDLVSGFEAAAKAKAEREAKELAERLENERKERERIEAQRIENERLKKENEEKEAQLKAAREVAEKERLKQEVLRKAEQEKADAVLAEQRKQAANKEAELKAKAEAEKKLADEKAAKIKAEADAKLKAEQEEKAKLQAELKAKQDAEAKAKAEAEAKEKQRLAEEKKAALAPDKDKLKKAIEECSLVIIYSELKSEASQKIGSDISEKFKSFTKWALTQIETLQ